jgi:type II secretory ATPase GspE/PulE/Tfp pilus assembly ATPase PilB-like protein
MSIYFSARSAPRAATDGTAPPGHDSTYALALTLDQDDVYAMAEPAEAYARARPADSGDRLRRPPSSNGTAHRSLPGPNGNGPKHVAAQPAGDRKEASAEAAKDPEDPRAARVVRTIIGEALRLGASRILILPSADRLKVAYRIHGVVCPRPDLPRQFHYAVLATLMSMANLYGLIKVAGPREEKLRVVFKAAKYGLSAVLELAPSAWIAETVRAQANELGYRFFPLDESQSPMPAALAMVPSDVARAETVLPLALEGTALLVAMGRAPTTEIMGRLDLRLRRPLAVALAPEGALLAAIERHYGPSDPESVDASLWKLESEAERAMRKESSAFVRLPRLANSPWHQAAKPLVDHLRQVFRDRMFDLFEGIAMGGKLCTHDRASGELRTVLPYAHLVATMPPASQRYIETKISVLRTALVVRLEEFLERDELAKALSMSYCQYLACCAIAHGRVVSIDPAADREARVNFLYGLAVRSFAEVESNGGLLALLAEHPEQLSQRVASLLDNGAFVRDPAAAREWLARLIAQTSADSPLDFDEGPVVHLLELLIAEALQVRASRIAIVPQEDGVEVAHRIQTALYRRTGVAINRLYPLLALLRMLADDSGRLRLEVGGEVQHLQARFQLTEHGLCAVIHIVPDPSAAETCKAHAANAGYLIAELENRRIPDSLLRLLPKAVALKKCVLPLEARAGTLTVVVAAPPTPSRMEDLRLTFNNAVSVALAPEHELRAAIHRHYSPPPAEPAPSPTATELLLGS